jgi:hypothetical protein
VSAEASPSTFRFTFVTTREELLDAQRAASRGDRSLRRIRRGMVAFVMVMVVVVLAAGGDVLASLHANGVNLLLIVAVFAATGPLARLSTRVAMWINPKIAGEKTLELSESGVRWIGGGRVVHAAWSSVRQVYETDAYFIIRASALVGLFLPKHVVPAGELAAVREFLRDHAAPAADDLPR